MGVAPQQSLTTWCCLACGGISYQASAVIFGRSPSMTMGAFRSALFILMPVGHYEDALGGVRIVGRVARRNGVLGG